eukprot:scaffold134976_cov21-Tisochrysis_lutea.AAC.5
MPPQGFCGPPWTPFLMLRAPSRSSSSSSHLHLKQCHYTVRPRLQRTQQSCQNRLAQAYARLLLVLLMLAYTQAAPLHTCAAYGMAFGSCTAFKHVYFIQAKHEHYQHGMQSVCQWKALQISEETLLGRCP